MCRDGGGLQVFRERGHYLGRYRACPSDTKETILVWARPISQLRVLKANLGPSTRLIFRQRMNLKMLSAKAAIKALPDLVLSAPNAPVPFLDGSAAMITGQSEFVILKPDFGQLPSILSKN